jgi:hypothetical protein
VSPENGLRKQLRLTIKVHRPVNRKPPRSQDAWAHDRHEAQKTRAVLPKKQFHETVKTDDQNAFADQPQTAKLAGIHGARTAHKRKTARGAQLKNSFKKQSKLTIKCIH